MEVLLLCKYSSIKILIAEWNKGNAIKYPHTIRPKFLPHLFVIQEPFKIINIRAPFCGPFWLPFTAFKLFTWCALVSIPHSLDGLINCVHRHKYVIPNVFSSYYVGSQSWVRLTDWETPAIMMLDKAVRFEFMD